MKQKAYLAYCTFFLILGITNSWASMESMKNCSKDNDTREFINLTMDDFDWQVTSEMAARIRNNLDMPPFEHSDSEYYEDDLNVFLSYTVQAAFDKICNRKSPWGMKKIETFLTLAVQEFHPSGTQCNSPHLTDEQISSLIEKL